MEAGPATRVIGFLYTLSNMKRIQDGLHGYIRLSDKEVDILDSSQMQRLRRVRQLGLSSLVYPSANHTRFEHSLGVMHLAGKFAESLELSEDMRKKARIAGLLHDSGHGPFSHASEVVARKEGLSHEELSCRVADQLEESIPVDTEEVKDLIHGRHEINVIAGDIDADRIDYLMRDSHTSGLEYGRIDYQTIISSARMVGGELVFDGSAVPALQSLFTSRFHMIKTLYTHHASRIAEKILQRCLEDFTEDRNILDFMQMDDYSAHAALKTSSGVSKELYDRISNRKLYKTVLEWGETEVNREGLKVIEDRIEDPRELERKIAEKAGVKEHEVILDPPKTPEIQRIDVKVSERDNIRKLNQISELPGYLEDAEWRTVSMKVYAPEDKRSNVRKTAENVLESHRNALGDFMQ